MPLETEALAQLAQSIARMLQRPRVLKPQTLRHLEQHVDTATASLRDFLATAAQKLEDYELEILFAPVFTPTPEEQMEVVELLAKSPPSAGEVDVVIQKLSREVQSCPIVLPEAGSEGEPQGGTAPLFLHPVLIERFVHLLRLENAPRPHVAEIIQDALPSSGALVALALMRQKGFTPGHQSWLARFLIFISNRHAIDAEMIGVAGGFLASQSSLIHEDLLASLNQLIRATLETGNFAQQGRAYWSTDVAEHHNFRGAGMVDRQSVEKARKELGLLELLKTDLEAYGDLGLASSDNGD